MEVIDRILYKKVVSRELSKPLLRKLIGAHKRVCYLNLKKKRLKDTNKIKTT